MISNLLTSLLSALIVNNLLVSGVGLERLTSDDRRIKPVLIKTGIVSVLAFLIFNVNYIINTFLLSRFNLGYLSLLVVVVLVILFNELYLLTSNKTKLNLPKENFLILNSVILLIGLLTFNDLSYEVALVSVIGSLAGFMLFSILFSVLINRLNVAPIIKSFKGLPILLIILGLIALILNGLGGVF